MVDHPPLMTAESLVDEDGSVIVRDDLEELLKVTWGLVTRWRVDHGVRLSGCTCALASPFYPPA